MKAKWLTARVQLASTARLASCMALCVAGVALLCLVLTVPVHAQGISSLGVTGNLSDMVFAVLPGGTILPTDNSMLLINETGSPRTIQLHVDAPDGVAVELNQPETLELTGEEHTAVSIVRISVDSHVPPGEYPVVIRALSPGTSTSNKEVEVVPGVAMRARVHVGGRAGVLVVNPTDLGGRPISAQVEVAYGTDEHWTTLYSGVGQVEYEVAPGTYRVQARIGGHILSLQEVTIAAGERRDVQLAVNTVSFANVGLVPHRRGRRLVYYDLRYDIRNQLAPMENVNVRLKVFPVPGDDDGRNSTGRDAVFTDNNFLAVLPTGLQPGKFTYAPDGRTAGWGRHLLQLTLVGEDGLLTQSSPLEIVISPQGAAEWFFYGVGLAGTWWAIAPGWKRAVPLLLIVVVSLAVWLALITGRDRLSAN